MPLLDHFHPPLFTCRHWESFHASWAATMMRRLNRRLPAGFFAEIQTHVGGRVEVDLGTFENLEFDPDESARRNGGGATTLLAPTWIAAPATWSLPAEYPDSIEVQVLHDEGGPVLVAVVELVSPGNKDRPNSRRDFVAKCCTYLRQGVGLVIVDIVTSRHANLHNELASFLSAGSESQFAPNEHLYATSYRPVRTSTDEKIEVWPARLEIGQPLADVPLHLSTRGYVQLELNASYEETCVDCQID